MVSTTLKNKDAQLHRVNVDVAEYKQQRAERLAKQVEEWATQVRESGESYAVRPMNPADRRVVHNVISEYEDLETHSEGEGRDRHVVIVKA